MIKLSTALLNLMDKVLDKLIDRSLSFLERFSVMLDTFALVKPVFIKLHNLAVIIHQAFQCLAQIIR